VFEGAYYADAITAARREGRVCRLSADPLIGRRAFWDLGVDDSTAIWVAQFVGREIRLIDFIEGQGQALAFYVEALRSRGYGAALCVLPHDGARRDTVAATAFEDHLRQAGFEVRTVKNQGKGAAMQRIEAGRRLFPRLWFDEEATAAGLEALAAYHERRDPHRNVGLGPEHDWSSHAADAFGLMCIAYEEPVVKRERTRSAVAGRASWMGG
jgi:phage terminase large subunit